MGIKKDLTGHRFGKLVVIKESAPNYHFDKKGYKHRYSMWECKCDCGETTVVSVNDLNSSNTKSCGCLELENRKNINERFVSNEIWNHENAQKFHEWDRQIKGTKITTLRPDRLQANNKSGVRGVCWDKKRKKWSAYITFKGKRTYLGYFKNKTDAIAARKEAEEKYFQPILEKYDKKSPHGNADLEK